MSEIQELREMAEKLLAKVAELEGKPEDNGKPEIGQRYWYVFLESSRKKVM